MSPQKAAPVPDKILIVEADPRTADLIGRQALQAVGYEVQVACDGAAAIASAVKWSPDVMLVDLNLPGLSGKDLMVALDSQGIHMPIIVLAPRGSEAAIIQTFRLGASDYILLPAREAEVVNAVQRVMQQVRDRRERDRLARQLQYANQDLEARVRELTTIFALGKAMTSVTNQAVLLDSIMDAALRTTRSDVGWFLLREDLDQPFLLAVERGLPAALGAQRNRAWDDGISGLVAMSGEALEIHGEALRRFKIASLGQAAFILPIKSQRKVFGLLVVMRAMQAYTASEQTLLTALADYASISLVNARLFRAVEERARTYQYGAALAQLAGKVHNDLLRGAQKALAEPAAAADQALQGLSKSAMPVGPAQQQALAEAAAAVRRVGAVAAAIPPARAIGAPHARVLIHLGDVLSQSLRRLQPVARYAGVSFAAVLPELPLQTCADAALIGQVFDSLLTNAVKFSQSGKQVGVRLGAKDGSALVSVFTPGAHISEQQASIIFLEKPVEQAAPVGFGGLGIRLSLAKEILVLYQGRIWCENQAGEGVTFFAALPLIRC